MNPGSNATSLLKMDSDRTIRMADGQTYNLLSPEEAANASARFQEQEAALARLQAEQQATQALIAQKDAELAQLRQRDNPQLSSELMAVLAQLSQGVNASLQGVNASLQSGQDIKNALAAKESAPAFRMDKLLHRPERFSGPSGDPSEDPASITLQGQAWLQQQKSMFQLQAIPEAYQVPIAAGYLSGGAAQWWAALAGSNNEPKTWADFEKRFSAIYLRDKKQMMVEASAKLLHFRQLPAETIQALVKRFDLIMCWMPQRRAEEATRQIFRHGLNAQYQKWLLTHRDAGDWDLDELIAALLRFDSTLQANVFFHQSRKR